MRLRELVQRFPRRASGSVPDWMLGYFKRQSITFADGRSDRTTFVAWLQCRNFTVDLRLPPASKRMHARPWEECTREELRELANYEGWYARARYEDDELSWQAAVSLQLHDRWSEPAELRRVGNCMIEFSPSGSYVEDWRLQTSRQTGLVGLSLSEERELPSGRVRHRGGGLIVCGEVAALVRGRGQTLPGEPAPKCLRDVVEAARGNAPVLAQLLGCETSLARGSLDEGFEVEHSTRPDRVGQPLLCLDGFELSPDRERVVQRTREGGVEIERRFSIDSLEPDFAFAIQTDTTPAAQKWFTEESETLERYLEEPE